MQRLVLLLFALAIGVLPGCNGNGGSSGGVTQVTATEANDLVLANQGNPDFVVLDVRTPGEFALGHLENALNIDYLDAGFQAGVDALDRGKTYLVYCQSGGRSAGAADEMDTMGFDDLYDMTGGFPAWVAGGFPWTTQ